MINEGESEKKFNSGGIRRNTGLCERGKEYRAGRGGGKMTFVVPSAVSVPLKPCFVVTGSAAKRPQLLAAGVGSGE